MSATEGVRAAVVITGDELLRGFVQDANSSFLANELRHVGVDLAEVRFSADDLDTIVEALVDAQRSTGARLVLVSGGLGPTHDDRTSEAVAIVSGHPLELRADALLQVEGKVRAFGRMATPEDAATFDPGNRKQATVPATAEVFEPGGTAPGYAVVAGSDGRAPQGTVIVVLPGPPTELQYAWRQARRSDALVALLEQVVDAREHVLRIWGVPESLAARELEVAGHVDDPSCRVTLCARDGELELSVRGTDPTSVDGLADQLRAAFGARVFAVDDERPVAELVGGLLHARGLELAIAESCTGGLLGSMLTEVAGSSSWFQGGVVSYSNTVKVDVLGVAPTTIERFGAVSEYTAQEMAAGVRRLTGAGAAIAITGVAGPGGGTAAKPVGTVFVAVVVEDDAQVLHLTLPGSRAMVRRRACAGALHALRQQLS